MVDIKEIKSGVGAFIVAADNPDFFLGITELITKRSTNKLQGMYSPPFETIEDGETHYKALKRVFAEEVTVVDGKVTIPKNLGRSKLCLIQLQPGIWLHAYLLHASKGLIFRVGEKKDEVGVPYWVEMGRVLKSSSSPDCLTFRPGTLEIIQSYQRYLLDRQNFAPLIYQKTFHSVPAEVFDRLEHPVDQNKALSRFCSSR